MKVKRKFSSALGLTAMIIEQVINEPLWLSTYTRFVWG
jgi:hypothetical protein